MRAGKLDRTIVIERVSNSSNDSGAVGETWTTLVTLRAQLMDRTADETQDDRGAVTKSALTFRCRYYAGITVADRVSYESAAYNIRGVQEFGRNREMEIACERIGP
jgi:SPP1 family predicted phage head-tail adaptor